MHPAGQMGEFRAFQNDRDGKQFSHLNEDLSYRSYRW
jgi:hypothetical protein